MVPSLLIPLSGAALAAGLLLWRAKIPFSYNLRNLVVRWKTSTTTALAFTLVVTLLVVMLAFVNGMYRLTQSSGQPGNVVILSEGTTDEAFSNLGFSDVGDLENQPGILRDSGRPLCSRETYLVVNQPIPDAAAGRLNRRFLQVRGIDDPEIAARVHGMRLVDGGRWFSKAGVSELPGAGDGPASSRSAVEVVLGDGIARELAKDRAPDQPASARNPQRLEAGDSFAMGDRRWLVVGVMLPSGATFDSEVWAKRSVIGPMFGKETYTSLVARTAGPAAARQLAEFFNTRYTKAAVQAQVETEYFASLSETNVQFLYAIAFVAGVMALGGMFGVMNTMYAAISQRTRDIGVLRMLGFARWQLLVSFLLESLALALIGGLLGCALGSLADGWTANSIISSGAGGGKFVVLQLVVDTNILAVGLLVALGMGGLGGLLPALRATRLPPLEALR